MIQIYIYSKHEIEIESVVNWLGCSFAAIWLVKHAPKITFILNKVLIVDETLTLVVEIPIVAIIITIVVSGAVVVIQAVLASPILIVIHLTVASAAAVVVLAHSICGAVHPRWYWWGLIVRYAFARYLALVLEPVGDYLLGDSLWAGLRFVALFRKFFTLFLIWVLVFNECFF